jgi:histidyl-tRNA synthetase
MMRRAPGRRISRHRAEVGEEGEPIYAPVFDPTQPAGRSSTDMKFQPPKGTRDFYPELMAWRRHLEDAWRRASVRHGFEEVDGPLFESLDLYKVKSGEGIVNELFHFEDRGGRQLAIRPEFTPTLARMVAAKAATLPRPIKWFCIPTLCRAERPQRGRLREFIQWNLDVLGAESSVADAECIFACVDLLRELGLESHQVKVRISHREIVRHILARLGVPDERMLEAFDLLDRREKMMPDEFMKEAVELGLDEPRVERFEQMCRRKYPAGDTEHLGRSVGVGASELGDLAALDDQLGAFGIAEWCEYDLGIVRGLAYYTGTVFEVHEVSGAERAMAGGGRYDKLIELMGGPAMPAVGFGMGDVVLALVLQDKGLLPDRLMPTVDAFVFATAEPLQKRVPEVVASLRWAGLHARMTYRATTNVGKLLKDAAALHARYAVILDEESVAADAAAVKDMTTGEQARIPLGELAGRIGSA